MAPVARPRRQPTDDWRQLRLLVDSPEQATYELLRPIVLFGQTPASRARQAGVSERTVRRKVARFTERGMRSLFEPEEPPVSDRRTVPLGVRRAIVELKAEHPPLSLREISAICRERFDRSVSHHTIKQILESEPVLLHPLRRLPRYREMTNPTQRRKAIVDLYLDGWRVTSIAGYLETTRTRVYETLARWEVDGMPGLADRSRAPLHHARKVDLKAMVAIRRLQANPELGEFRIHAALEQLGIHLSPRTCGRILALHRDLGAPLPANAPTRQPQAMPFAAQRRHQFWSVDVRYIEDHQLGTGKPAYVISILENFSRAFLASAISPRQDLTAFLIVLRAAIETHGAPEVLVSDSGSIFKAKHAQAIYGALGIQKATIAKRQAWQNYIETNFNVMRRMADYYYAGATTWAELQAEHERFFHNYNHQPHAAHPDRSRGRRSPAAVLGWVHGAWCESSDLDRLFRIRSIRHITVGGYLRFRHWRLYGERGLVGKPAAVWIHSETLTIEHATESLAQYGVALEPDGRRLREVSEPQIYATSHASPQPFLPTLDEVEWRPAQRLAPYRARRQHQIKEQQAQFLEMDQDELRPVGS